MFNNIPKSVKNYLSEYHYKIELHAHTSPCSACSCIPATELPQLMQEQHYDAVVIVNHFTPDSHVMKEQDPVGVYLEDFRIAKEEGKRRGVQVLLGAEYRFTENMNDYLVYGVDEAFLRETANHLDMGIEEFYRKYHCQSRLIIQAHPFRDGMALANPECLDGIETMNMHPGHNSRVSIATRYASEKKFPVVTIGTDLHHFGHEGLSALRTRVLPENEMQLVEILRSRDYLFEIDGCPMLPHLYFDSL